MDNIQARNQPRPKEPVTIRLDVEVKAKLQQLAGLDKQTVSSLIDHAIREFLDRRLGVDTVNEPETIEVRHAALPDTCVLRAFHSFGGDKYKKAQEALNLPKLHFLSKEEWRTECEWRNVLNEVFSGRTDLVESINWLPIFWHTKPGLSSPTLDWVGPFLEIFVGHCVFVRKDFVEEYLAPEYIKNYEEFFRREKPEKKKPTGRDLSLRSLVAWVQQLEPDASKSLARSLEIMWTDAVVGCQLGTDFHMAVCRIAPILTSIAGTSSNDIRDPALSGLGDLDRGFQEFLHGVVTGFTGNLLHSADLLSRKENVAFLLAGPADLRIPSLNTLAGRKGFLSTEGDEKLLINKDLEDNRLLKLWEMAVNWFYDEVINTESPENLHKIIKTFFDPKNSSLEKEGSEADPNLEMISILKSLMQTWVKWFASPKDAYAFIGDGGTLRAEALVQHYEKLCDHLNPTAPRMEAPKYESSEEQAFWKFPVLSRSQMKIIRPDVDIQDNE